MTITILWDSISGRRAERCGRAGQRARSGRVSRSIFHTSIRSKWPRYEVHVPTPLRSYTAGAGAIDVGGRSVAELLAEIDRRYPGFRFRIINEQDGIREHIRIFVNEDEARDLSTAVASKDVVHIMCALSGGRF